MEVLYILFTLVFLPILYIVVFFGSKRLRENIDKNKLRGISNLLGRLGYKPTRDDLRKRLKGFVRIISYIFYIVIIYLGIISVSQIFPSTRQYGRRFLELLSEPLDVALEVIYQVVVLVLKFIVLGVLAYIIIWILDRVLTLIIARGYSRRARVRRATLRTIFKVVKITIVVIIAIYFVLSIPITRSPYFYWAFLSIVGLLIIVMLPKVIDVIAGVIVPFIYDIGPGDLIEVGDHFGLIIDRGLVSVLIETRGGGRDQIPTRSLVWRGVRVVCQDYEKLNLWLTIDIDTTEAKIVREIEEALRSDRELKGYEVNLFIKSIFEMNMVVVAMLVLPSPTPFWRAEVKGIDAVNRVIQKHHRTCVIKSEVGQFT